MTKLLTALSLAAMIVTSPAWADSLSLAGPYVVNGNGFGANPRALTIQSHGPSATTESGCIAPSGGGLAYGSGACAPGNGVVGGNETMPIASPKQSAPTLSSLGITSGSQLGILFDAVQPQSKSNNVVNIGDLTLKLYNQGSLIYTVSGSWSNLATNPGNGMSDYLFLLDPAAVEAFNAAMAGNTSDQIALDSTISFASNSAGPDSYSFINRNTNLAPTPEPSSLALLGTGIFAVGFAMYSRRKRPMAATMSSVG